MTAPTPESFFDRAPPSPEGLVPRDQWDRPLIICPPGVNDDYRRKGDKLVPYHRASSFGKLIDDTYHLDLWIMRQTALGMALRPDLVARALAVGSPDEVKATDSRAYTSRKDQLNAIVEEAKEAAGSNVKSALGTAIHGATQLLDEGDSLDGLLPLLVERANAYYRFCREEGIVITSVEVFGVEDAHRVAGTWDRTGWWRREHKIVDVKTGESMDFAGVVYAVQLAEYAHMWVYDIATGGRMSYADAYGAPVDLEQGIIVHVPRTGGAPVEIFEVDLTVGWRHSVLVDLVKTAQKEGKKAIVATRKLDDVSRAIANCTTLEQLTLVYQASGGTHWTTEQRLIATQVANEIRNA